eukprot:TRINITY_DN10379_c0_g1_i1.p1 TRINITY_DN10379_c0_g1~~TRINITY_DN10379_c0_g1_i1.p1  ORF type:complete len:226 (+),score=23.90 TRINITY_DN10379_c0_g1_i1:8-685(+)
MATYGSTPSDGAQGPFFQEQDNKSLTEKISEGSWTPALKIGTAISAGSLITTGIMGFIFHRYPLDTIVCCYLILLGIVTLAGVTPIDSLTQLHRKWFPFLHSNRGRGVFLIFLGSLCGGIPGWVPIILAIVIVAVGAAHLVLSIYFRHTLEPTNFSDFPSAPSVETVGADVTHEVAQRVWTTQGGYQQTAYQQTAYQQTAYQQPSYEAEQVPPASYSASNPFSQN